MLDPTPTQTDANGAQFLLLRGAADFAAPEADAPVWDPISNSLRMPHRDALRLADPSRAHAQAVWDAVGPLAEDGFGQLARISPDGQQIDIAIRWPIADTQPLTARAETGVASGTLDVLLDPVSPPAGTAFRDLSLGGTRLAVLYNDGADEPGTNGVVLVDLDRRWQRTIPLSAAAHRVWVDAAGRVWVAGNTDLMLVDGDVLPQAYVPRPDRFEPIVINADAPRQMWRRLIPDGWDLRALAADAEQLYALMWEQGPNRVQAVFTRPLDPDPAHDWQIAYLANDVPMATDLRAVSDNTVLLMVPRDSSDTRFAQTDLPLVALRPANPELGTLADGVLIPRRWPQPDQDAARFVSDAEGRTRIQTTKGPRGIYPLAQSRHGSEAVATLNPLDAGRAGADWHRVYIEACIPIGTRIQLEARVYDGDTPEGPFTPQPAPIWVPVTSELGFDGGRFEPETDRQGLFEVLLQRDGGINRRMAGRRLQLRLTLVGDGRHSPTIGAMRIYHPRNSWADQFLPAYMRQADPAEASDGPANGADLRDRLLASLEGMLTPVENRIAAAECWLYPESAPSDRLAPLAGMIGASAPAHWPELRRRRWIAATPELQQKRGTLAGLSLALDIVTDGAVARGHVIPVETYRLRRTAGTILGLDFDDADHPLTLGTQMSGNSIVGPSLILSDETGRDFLALFAPELARTATRTRDPLSQSEKEQIAHFFDRHAHRVDIVLHGPARTTRALIEDILPDHIPAGVLPNILETDQSFVLGLSPLLGIDTLLQASPAWRRVMLDDTYLDREGILSSPAAFRPDIAGYQQSIAALQRAAATLPPQTGDTS